MLELVRLVKWGQHISVTPFKKTPHWRRVGHNHLVHCGGVYEERSCHVEHIRAIRRVTPVRAFVVDVGLGKIVSAKTKRNPPQIATYRGIRSNQRKLFCSEDPSNMPRTICVLASQVRLAGCSSIRS